jgi:cytochrome c-type biogenesis protein CcmF
MITADTTLVRDGKEVARMYPARWFYRKHEDEATTEVAIRRGFAEDVYLVMPAFSVEEQSASMGIHINPLVNWVWAGFGVLALGTWHRAAARDGLLVCTREPARQRGDRIDVAPGDAHVAVDALRAAGGSRGREERAAEADRERDHLHVRLPAAGWFLRHVELLGTQGAGREARCVSREGKDHDQIIEAFVKDFGSQAVLTAPIRQRLQSRRLAVSVRDWRHRTHRDRRDRAAVVVRSEGRRCGDAGLDPSISARLDDELRDLD